jgi:cyanophycin synthetase
MLKNFRLVAFDNFYTYCAADALDIPVRRHAGDTFVVGTGCYSQWISNTATEQTLLLAANAARSKEFTSSYLSRCGLPVAKGAIARSEKEALAIAAQLTFPVVVKPSDLDNGSGVSAGIRSEKQLIRCWREAREMSDRVLVERHHEGDDLRLTVAHGDVVLIMRRIAWAVVGDGNSTIEELVQDAQASNGSKPDYRKPKQSERHLDVEALGILEELNLTPGSVLPLGKKLVLRRKGNISAGGTQESVPPANVHPDNIALAARAAHLMKLDIAGVDLIIADVGKSWRNQDAIICEVNAVPQVGGRICPDFHRSLLEKLLGPECRVPVHAVIGRNSAMPTDSDATSLAQELGCNAVSTPNLIYLDGARVEARFQSAADAAIAVLEDTGTRSALIVLDADEIIRAGLPCDRFETLKFWHHEDTRCWGDIDKAELRALIGPHYAALTLPGEEPVS